MPFHCENVHFHCSSFFLKMDPQVKWEKIIQNEIVSCVYLFLGSGLRSVFHLGLWFWLFSISLIRPMAQVNIFRMDFYRLKENVLCVAPEPKWHPAIDCIKRWTRGPKRDASAAVPHACILSNGRRRQIIWLQEEVWLHRCLWHFITHTYLHVTRAGNINFINFRWLTTKNASFKYF